MNFIFLRTLLLNGCARQGAGVFLLALATSLTGLGQDHKKKAQEQSLTDSLVVTSIVIEGNKKTKIYIIQRELPFSVGDKIANKDLQPLLKLCKQRIFNTALFIEVQVESKLLALGQLHVQITVKERWYILPLPYFTLIDRNFNQWWSEFHHDFNRVNYGIDLTHSNLTGRNDMFDVLLINGYSQQLAFKYSLPFINKKLKTGLSSSISWLRKREINYTTVNNKQVFLKTPSFVYNQFQASLSYLYRPAIKTKHSLSFTYTNETVSDTVITLKPTYFKNADPQRQSLDINYSLQYFNVDYNYYPTRGFELAARFDGRVFKQGGSVSNFFFSGAYFLPFGSKNFISFEALGNLKLPFNQPYANQRLVGYSLLNLQGLEYYVIDGVAAGLGKISARRLLFDFALKNPFRIKNHERVPFKIYAKLFANGGLTYNPQNDGGPLSNRWLTTSGFGVDVVTFYDLIIKLEYSFNQLNERGLFIRSGN